MSNKIKVACFGEVLWDIFPSGKRAGGAPFNVAYNLSRMGVEAYMISRVGKDALGDELLQKIKSWHISTEGIQVDAVAPTSTVEATFDERNEAHYQILENVAWDAISVRKQDIEYLEKADAFIFGSLATRSKETRDTLFELIEHNKFNVFDINLREPFYDVHVIKELLHKTQLAKFNKAELRMMLEFLGKEYISEEDSIRFIQDTFGVEEVIISKGSKGAMYGTQTDCYLYPAVPIEIKDTVGSGDSFLAGFLSKRLAGASANDIMLEATALGAYITSQEGACPDYDYETFAAFKAAHLINQ